MLKYDMLRSQFCHIFSQHLTKNVLFCDLPLFSFGEVTAQIHTYKLRLLRAIIIHVHDGEFSYSHKTL